MLVSQREFARQRGCQPSYITKLIAKGIVVLVDGKVDTVQANAALEASRDPAKAHMAKVNAEQRERAKAPPADSGEPSAPSYAKAKTAREMYGAQNAKLDYEERIGRLVDKADVDREFSSRVAAARDAFHAISDRLAARVAAESDAEACRRLIDEEIRLAMTRFAGSAH